MSLLPRLAAVVALALVPASAEAYSRGVSFHGCSGCHTAGDHRMEVTTTPSTLVPGERATVRIAVIGSGAVAGLFAEIGSGTVTAVSGGGLARTEGGVTHDGPRTISGGTATFELAWTAPSTPGSVRFSISSVVADGNGRSSGDGAVDDVFDFVYGCAPATYYRDFDGDGHGQRALPRIHCAGGAPEGYSELDDDCSDSDERAHPGAEDVCNRRDDDCDGMVDEGAAPVDLYPDGDGDGYYGTAERESGMTMFGCGASGWAAERGDCAPSDPDVNPAAVETCNLRDDDCDLDVDERVRPQCGQGWCRRNAFTCDVDDCVPGEPRTEECNVFDDDCDGAVDEGACAPGEMPGRDAGTGSSPSDGSGCSASRSTEGAGALAWIALVWLVIRRRTR